MIQLSEFFQYSFVLILKRKSLVGASRVRCGESGTPSTIIYTPWSSRRYELGCDAPVVTHVDCLKIRKSLDHSIIELQVADLFSRTLSWIRKFTEWGAVIRKPWYCGASWCVNLWKTIVYNSNIAHPTSSQILTSFFRYEACSLW